MFTTNDSGNCAAEEGEPSRNADAADYLTRQATAALLGTILAELRRHIRLGEIATIKLGDQLLIKRTSLERFLVPIQLAGGRTLDRAQLRSRVEDQE